MNFRRHLYVLISIILLWGLYFGCAGAIKSSTFVYLQQDRVENKTKVIPIYIDIRFNEAERKEIESAIDRWNSTLNGYLELKVMKEPFDMEIGLIEKAIKKHEIYLVLRLDSNSKLFSNNPGNWTLGFTDSIGGDLIHLIPDNIKKGRATIYEITLHELGHIFGVKHVNGGLMNTKYERGKFLCIDEETVRRVSEWYGYDWRRMNYCKAK